MLHLRGKTYPPLKFQLSAYSNCKRPVSLRQNDNIVGRFRLFLLQGKSCHLKRRVCAIEKGVCVQVANVLSNAQQGYVGQIPNTQDAGGAAA